MFADYQTVLDWFFYCKNVWKVNYDSFVLRYVQSRIGAQTRNQYFYSILSRFYEFLLFIGNMHFVAVCPATLFALTNMETKLELLYKRSIFSNVYLTLGFEIISRNLSITALSTEPPRQFFRRTYLSI